MKAYLHTRLRQFLIDPIVPITYLIGFLLIVTGVGGLAGYEPDVPYGVSILDLFYGGIVVGVAWWMMISPANPRPRWIISFLTIAGSLGGLLTIDAPYGASMLIMSPALITVMASGQFAALFLYPLFLIFAISIGQSDGEILTPGGISFNVLIIVTLWAARNQGIHATKLAWQAQQTALQAEERTEHEAQLRHFLRLFQHELRNIVDGIRGMIPTVRIMLDDINPAIRTDPGPSGVTIEDIFRAIDLNAEALHTVAQQLLVLSRDEQLGLLKQPTLLRPLLEQAHIEAASRAARHGRQITTCIECEPDLTIYGEPTWIGLAIRTGVQNAIDALSQAGLNGVVTLRGRRTENSLIQVEIGDNGPGLPPAYVAQLSVLNEQSHLLGWTTKSGGSGLGIAFMIQVMRLHDGTVAFSNQPGGGAKVLLHFPIPREECDG
jgi:signal transduction histidine kinase